jgi:NAD-dependent dihydropyrimidine dehydrogenase PreA subunit
MKVFGGGNLYKRAAECLDYIFDFPYKQAFALGMKSEQEVIDNLEYLENRKFTESYSVQGKHIHIEDYCSGCGKCTQRCPQKALYIENGRSNCKNEICLLCGYCAAACPDFAIKIL